jgi:hypothetical protein
MNKQNFRARKQSENISLFLEEMPNRTEPKEEMKREPRRDALPRRSARGRARPIDREKEGERKEGAGYLAASAGARASPPGPSAKRRRRTNVAGGIRVDGERAG